ncbi:RNA polymerase sigma factor [Streptomyces diacarni]|uniref:RNA polymerase sigma factor n=1 Tax=Streptomyces diacarni TaxID=2800381 RepID=A0A367EEG8_9ACTN|nr:RNA polymerase sigma factor [Streptomyces diacarni]RCG15620.1 RNA polymerase sigma factor [Streptomyces diacarni]
MRRTEDDDVGSERALIRAGDRGAFSALYEQHARGVYQHALRLTGDWAAAEEVLSETFLAAWRARGKVEPEGGSLRPWLLTIATHKALGVRRGRRRLSTFLAQRSAPEAVADFAEETAGRIDDARRLAAVNVALDRLRRPEREVLLLCVWAGLDYAEAAEALGVPVGTVRSRLSRARARLARLSEQVAAAERRNGTEKRREPRPRRGEGEGGAVFASLPLREDTL